MKIAVIDIDGVLNYYPQTFLDFVFSQTLNKFETLDDAKNKISYSYYKNLKQMYRNSDFKNNAKPRKYTKDFLLYLRKHGYLIYIITSRELYKNNMLEKTICWFNKNELIYDFIYESKKKDFTIFEKFGKIDILVEDSTDNINKIMKICDIERCYNIMNNENKDFKVNCRRVWSLREIWKDLELERSK